jgi:ferritin-like protein
MADTPQNGWWPDEESATVTQMFFKDGKPTGNIVKITSSTSITWRAYDLTKMNKSGTGANPITDGSVATREEAKQQVEKHVEGFKEKLHDFGEKLGEAIGDAKFGE